MKYYDVIVLNCNFKVTFNRCLIAILQRKEGLNKCLYFFLSYSIFSDTGNIRIKNSGHIAGVLSLFDDSVLGLQTALSYSI